MFVVFWLRRTSRGGEKASLSKGARGGGRYVSGVWEAFLYMVRKMNKKEAAASGSR